MRVDYFYDGQIRRYWGQFLRIFTGLQYGTYDKDQNLVLKQIPVKMALQSTLVAAIMQGNSENTAMTYPQIACWQTDMQPSINRRRMPNFVDTLQVVEREFNEETGKYEVDQRGSSYTVQRFMPVAYDITMQVDIVTSTEMQKHQIVEQILILFNPSIDIQSTENALDWTSLTTVELTDIRWSVRSIPIGNSSNTADITSLTFKMPIWISPPVKVMKHNIIEQIVTNITEYDKSLVESNNDPDVSGLYWSETDVMSRLITTPGNHMINVTKNGIILLGDGGAERQEFGQIYDWLSLVEKYGTYREGVSQLRLKTNDNLNDRESDIIGTFIFDPDHPNKLICDFDMNTLPQDTIRPVTGIIDPTKVFPGNNLPVPAAGQRYLILGNIYREAMAWGGNLNARANDIIEYDGSDWFVEFEAEQAEEIEYVKNLNTNDQLMFQDNEWAYTIYKKYRPGEWRLFI